MMMTYSNDVSHWDLLYIYIYKWIYILWLMNQWCYMILVIGMPEDFYFFHDQTHLG